jgi:site-specific recombinase XerD
MKSTETFSVLIWANKSKTSKNEAPLLARVTVNGKRVEISLKKKVNLNSWNAKTGYLDSGEDAKSVNNYITQVKAKLFKIYTKMQTLEESISAEAIKLEFTGTKEERKTILQVFDYHNDQMTKIVGIDAVPATLVKFKTIRTKLASFIKYQYKKNDYYLPDLSHQFLTNFEYYLKTEENIQHNTTMKYIQNFKKIVNLAVRNDWLPKNPFSEFRCSFRKVERNVLTIEEIETIENKTFRMERLRQVKDLFIFSCYTGLAYIDVMRLAPNNISLSIDGEKWIFTERKKTGEKVRVPLLPKALLILEKYQHNPSVQNTQRLLPKISNQKLNAYLKEIADVCDIEKNLTFHLARHTFATTITLTNGVPIETVSKLLGHSSIKTTQIYAKVVEKKISEDMTMLKEKLTRNPKNKIKKAS